MRLENVKILVLEDNPDDLGLLKHNLKKLSFDYELKVSETKAGFISSLDMQLPDLVLSDFNLPDYNGLEALKEIRKRDDNIPFIIVSGAIGEELAIEIMREGANDYILKDNIKRLIPAIEREYKEYEIRLDKAQTENICKENERHFLSLLENPTDYIIYRIKINGSINNAVVTHVSPSIDVLFGLDEKSKHQYQSWFKNIHKEDIQKFRYANEVALKPPFFLDEVFRYNHPQSGLCWFHIRANGVTSINNPDKLEHMNGIISDITRLKKFEYELLLSKNKAEESDRLKTAFLQNISHEIRTPLNGILGFSDLLEKEEDPGKSKDFINLIKSSGQQLLRLLEDVMEIAKLETGEIDIREDSFNINELIDDLYKFYSEYKEINLLDIELEIQKPLQHNHAMVYTDESRIKQIFINLIDNAFKFTKKGKIKFGYTVLQNLNFKFFVSDTGIGIENEKLKIIFERFRQIDDGSERKYSGTGLGLAICKNIVEYMGGEIWAESILNRGTTFYYTIPDLKDNEDKNQTMDEIRDIDEFDFSGITILIAEDDYNNYMLINEYLESTNCTIHYAKNGNEVIDIVKENGEEIDLILMDIMMPFTNGIEALRALKKMDCAIPIIAQTAYIMEIDEKQMREEGFDDFMAKPIDQLQLLNKMFKFL